MKCVENFDELMSLLRTLSSWGDSDMYDAVGILSLLGSCLENLAEKGNEGDLERSPYVLTSKQIEILNKLAAYCREGPLE